MDYLPNKRIKPKKEQKRPTKWLVLTILFLCQLFFYTLIRLESSHAKAEISKLLIKKQELKSNTSVLIVEKERLCSPERILNIARSELNLSTPSADQVIYMDSLNE